MCRIAGIIDKNAAFTQLTQDVKAMCDVMAHGGPDGEGLFSDASLGLVFGHRRLALLDLSPAGHQPMTDYHNHLVISFNGEIYNFLEIKENLLQLGVNFKTKTDTEIILAAYAKWGVDSFSMLKGMFAFAIYDKTTNRTYLVRDSAGIKPLYFNAEAERLMFASEVKAFLATSTAFEEEPNWPIYFLAFGHLPEPYTTLAQVKMLKKGHYLLWDHHSQRYSINTYVKEINHQPIDKRSTAHEAVKNSLSAAVQKHLIADAPIGVFLSGGIDSSLLCLVAHQELLKGTNHSLHTLSINFDESTFSEVEYQKIIQTKINSIHSQYRIDETHFYQALPQAIKAIDQPSADGINTWFICSFAKKKGLKAVLSGIGADELFGGYPSFNRMKWVNLFEKFPTFILKTIGKIKPLVRFHYLSYRNAVGQYLFLRGFFVPTEIAQLLRINIKQVDEALSGLDLGSAPRQQYLKASWLEYHLYLQNQLLKDTDSMSMQHGVEVRVPFLDQDFRALVDQITPEIRFSSNKPKYLLISSFAKLIPKAIWNRPKMGFVFPFEKWLRKHSFFLAGLEKGGHSTYLSAFKQGKLHWSKAMALYQLQHFKHQGKAN